jgi:anti-sigma B factor antagonist
MKVDVAIEKKDDIVICRVSGEITFSTSPDLRTRLMAAIDGGAKKVVINLSGVGYVDSSGMATLVELLQKIKSLEGDLKLAEAPDKIIEILDMVRLKDIFDFEETEDKAINSF